MATATLDDQEKRSVKAEFRKLVNMSAKQIGQWLDTEESKSVGQKKEGDSESIGHHSGEKIIHILGKKANELDGDDYAHMRKVVG